MRFEAWIADELSVHRQGFPHVCPKSRIMRSFTFKKLTSRAARDTPPSSASGGYVAKLFFFKRYLFNEGWYFLGGSQQNFSDWN
jgi:hypothetical protein